MSTMKTWKAAILAEAVAMDVECPAAAVVETRWRPTVGQLKRQCSERVCVESWFHILEAPRVCEYVVVEPTLAVVRQRMNEAAAAAAAVASPLLLDSIPWLGSKLQIV